MVKHFVDSENLTSYLSYKYDLKKVYLQNRKIFLHSDIWWLLFLSYPIGVLVTKSFVKGIIVFLIMFIINFAIRMAELLRTKPSFRVQIMQDRLLLNLGIWGQREATYSTFSGLTIITKSTGSQIALIEWTSTTGNLAHIAIPYINCLTRIQNANDCQEVNYENISQEQAEQSFLDELILNIPNSDRIIHYTGKSPK